MNTCASIDGARRAQNCALYTSVCFVVSVPLFAGEERPLKEQDTSAHAWMTWNDTQGETLSHMCDV